MTRSNISLLLLLVSTTFVPRSAPAQSDRYTIQASAVTITRDDWGIAHIHGHTDADAVFGMIYAQCEDDFNRVEANYLTALGRTAEAEGERSIWQDLRQRLFIDPADLQKDYTASPPWLRKLMDAWADGINFYLARHPDVHPRVLTHFEPWMALSFTEGSIGGDIEKVDLRRLQDFYTSPSAANSATASLSRSTTPLSASTTLLLSSRSAAHGPAVALPLNDSPDPEPRGSNGFAIAPSNTAAHHALLLINPHTSFFFRSELQMSSDEGLNAYGAVTWGQFFIYQGFNDRAGWMHTSSNVDAVDEYLETVTGDSYRFDDAARPLLRRQITLSYTSPTGPQTRTFTALYTLHGPIIRAEGDKRISIQLMNTPIPALEQSYLRTKARNYADYRKTMQLMANSSNNTIYADADGTIAYWHGNFIPRRDPRFDYTKPVDGSDPATNWHGLTPLDQVPQLKNPASGFLFNVNDSPWNGAGPSSLKKSDFPAYVEQGLESARGVHALRVLTGQTGFTPQSLRAAAFDSYLPWFAKTLPALFTAYDALPQTDPSKSKLAPQVTALRAWDLRWSATSIPTSLAVFWGTELLKTAAPQARRAALPSEDFVAAKLPPATLLTALTTATDKLTTDFGTWQTPWGQINRFQRLTADIVQPFTDAGPSIPVPFTSSVWGSLASFGARQYPDTRKWYGTSGNSFVAIVEFGPRVHALAITAGGESGHPASKHFNDEAERYAAGNLREVYFYPDQLKPHTERTYHPGS